ncbi:fasciclin domain-containing protein [Colletotrichum costaricense]|uniref:Fasciclin domain-containing protein n=1 Tax=Colletotrichum costaricense TaxID=1209916 RepID=A0AAI9Z292_9PEZI|nr:fasciclin domain-containing protein [Colletotrichum costaricense]KAK1530748.1 fasciclin domain-containing protein [Colletotrichum costaricense]
MRFVQELAVAVVSLAPLACAVDPSLHSRQAQQSLSNALTSHADLSTFNEILNGYPSIISNITAVTKNKVTLLVPTNVALAKFLQQSNVSEITQLPVNQLLTILRYHTLDAPLTASNFSASRGITVPTKLRDELFNLRTPGPAIIDQYGEDAQGQVLFISPSTINPTKFRVRQGTPSDDHTASLRGGLGQTAELTSIDGVWDGGYFQSVDAVLEAPAVCSTTIKKLSSSLSALGDALDKIKLWRQLDNTANITCLGPNTAAFKEAGSPQSSLGNEDLKNALLFHTLPQTAYSDFLVDGQEFTSMANVTVRVTIKDNEIWFNDAKVISPNVLTNNGLIHILDRVMSANALPDSSTSSPTGTGSATPTSTATPPNAGNPMSESIRAAAVIALAAGLLLV